MDEYKPNRWRKRPVEVTAQRMAKAFSVDTLAGVLQGKAGDWLITGIQGEQFPCDDKIFRKSYEAAESQDTDKSSLSNAIEEIQGALVVLDSCDSAEDDDLNEVRQFLNTALEGLSSWESRTSSDTPWTSVATATPKSEVLDRIAAMDPADLRILVGEAVRDAVQVLEKYKGIFDDSVSQETWKLIIKGTRWPSK